MFKIKFQQVIVVLVVLAMTACSTGTSPVVPPSDQNSNQASNSTLAPTQPSTDTPLPIPTDTVVPTETLVPTSTPDLAATQQAEVIQPLLASYLEKGMLDSIDGTIKALPDYTAEFAKKGYFSDLFDTGETLPDTFVLSAHFKWQSTSASPSISGCGIAFGVQENDDRYLVNLDKDRILFTLKRGTYSYLVGRTKGPAGPAMGTPLDHDFVLIVKGQMAYVSVDGAITTYTLSADQPAAGKLAFNVLSGSNSDYGTRCEMTKIVLWTGAAKAGQKSEDIQSVLARFKDKGYIATTEGASTPIADFKRSLAEINTYYKWSWPAEVTNEYTNFVFSAHFKWDSGSVTPEPSGCGIGFGIKESGDHYAVFLDRENLMFFRGSGSRTIPMGAAGGERFPTILKPAEADFAVAVWDKNVTVSVNGVFVTYILSADQNAVGKIALSLFSGSNSDYGTKCEMTNIVFWTPK